MFNSERLSALEHSLSRINLEYVSKLSGLEFQLNRHITEIRRELSELSREMREFRRSNQKTKEETALNKLVDDLMVVVGDDLGELKKLYIRNKIAEFISQSKGAN